jgi:hypothetical protein
MSAQRKLIGHYPGKRLFNRQRMLWKDENKKSVNMEDGRKQITVRSKGTQMSLTDSYNIISLHSNNVI